MVEIDSARPRNLELGHVLDEENLRGFVWSFEEWPKDLEVEEQGHSQPTEEDEVGCMDQAAADGEARHKADQETKRDLAEEEDCPGRASKRTKCVPRGALAPPLTVRSEKEEGSDTPLGENKYAVSPPMEWIETNVVPPTHGTRYPHPWNAWKKWNRATQAWETVNTRMKQRKPTWSETL
ncbi:hypothetical protein BDZ91DRAFT_807061 [Kalaharituber pfeilii]|nr:hypothetical protein BDZ91DRAFT_807061 [Kalaharituber pfeilii]